MGQTKPVLVFTLMMKSTAEEKIIQNGKKKLVLDHLIVQKMDDDESGGDVQSILSFGAKALFEDDSQIDTMCTWLLDFLSLRLRLTRSLQILLRRSIPLLSESRRRPKNP